MRKVKHRISDELLNLQSKLFNGLMSFAIEFTKSSISDIITSADDAMDDKEINRLCNELYISLEHDALIQYNKSIVMHHSKLLEQYGIMTTSYYWLHDQHLRDTMQNQKIIKSRQNFLTSLHNVNQVLSAWKSTMVKIQTDLEIHRNAVKELLASSMSTPSLEVQLDDVIAAANRRYMFFFNLATRLIEYSTVLLQFEITGGEEPFETLIQQFKEERNKLQSCELSISVVERNLVQLLDPEDKIDQCWIENISDLLDDLIFSVQKKICDLEKDETSVEKTLQSDGQKLQVLNYYNHLSM